MQEYSWNIGSRFESNWTAAVVEVLTLWVTAAVHPTMKGCNGRHRGMVFPSYAFRTNCCSVVWTDKLELQPG